MIYKPVHFIFSLLGCVICISSPAQLTVTPGNNAAQLAGTLAGNGVIVSNATINCQTGASGNFNGTASNIGIAQGILLTTGSVNIAPGPNNTDGAGTGNGAPAISDPDLIKIEPQATHDVCILEFDAKPSCDTLKFTFAFGSEEYPEYVDQGYNDAFGIFVTGANPSGPAYAGYNMALIPGVAPPNNFVAIDNVNNGTGGFNICPPTATTGPCRNCAYYVDNCSGTSVQYDGFTKPITVSLPVVPCGNYHFKLIIGDSGDDIYDSGVFFVTQSLVCATSLTVTAATTTATCAANNGTATVTNVAGGSAPYTYVWSTTPAQSTQTATGLAPGTYTVTAVDKNGCLNGTQTVTVTGGGGFNATTAQTNVSCFGGSNGTAAVNPPSGGTAPYTYSWSTAPPQVTASASNLPAGSYTCQVTDATGCSRTFTFTLTAPPGMTVTTSSTPSSCGQSNGSASVSGVSGGTAPYTYSWNTVPAQNTQTASGLPSGTYSVTVTDAGGCQSVHTATVLSGGGFTAGSAQTNVSCAGGSDGTATVNPAGGASPYTYSWSTAPAQSGASVSNLQAGTYTCIVSDAAGCSQTLTFAITAPASLTVAISSTAALCGMNSGTATANPAGGTGPYTYSWNTAPAQNTQTATGLPAGTYSITVSDAKGCQSVQTVNVPAGGGFTATSAQTNITCFGNNNGSASVTPSGGNPPYTYAWSTTPVQSSPSISNMPAGSYSCTVTDAAGCVTTVTFSITQPPALTASVVSSVNVSCFGGNNGSATASGVGGTGSLTYSWNSAPVQNGAVAGNLGAGSYIVTVTDANGCTKTAGVTITAPPGLTVTATSTPSPCGIPGGTATANSGGGTAPHTYVWFTSPVQSSAMATGLAGSTTYAVLVSDANGCTRQQTVYVAGGQPPVAGFSFTPGDMISLLDPAVWFTDGSSGSAFTWSWNFGDSASGANNFSTARDPMHLFSDTGVYCVSLVISDAGGNCTDSIVKCLTVEMPFTFYIPNAFTPDENNLNELFRGYGMSIKEFEILVFDRWGNEIFYSNDIARGWNGRVRNEGEIVQEDVYVWKVHIKDSRNKPHTYIGHVTLLK